MEKRKKLQSELKIERWESKKPITEDELIAKAIEKERKQKG